MIPEDPELNHDSIQYQLKFDHHIIQLLNQRLPPLNPIRTSIGEIPAASETQTGIPFQDGFPCLPPPSGSNQQERHQITNQLSHPDHHSSSTSTPSTRQQQSDRETLSEPIGHRNTPIVPSTIPTSNSASKDLTKKEVVTNHSQPILPEAPSTGPATPVALTPDIQTIEKTSTATTATQIVDSEMSRKGEAWLFELKATYSQYRKNVNDGKPQPPGIPTKINYPRIGDSFPSAEKFKEACLWASWTAGHDMHVRNHYKADGWEKCVFTCRYDRSPPKGYACPFKIVAINRKPNKGTSDIPQVWTVFDCHLAHRNHRTTPGFYDPMGKRPYRKRQANGELENFSRETSDSELVTRKRAKRVNPLKRNSFQNLPDPDHPPPQESNQSTGDDDEQEEGEGDVKKEVDGRGSISLPFAPQHPASQLNLPPSKVQNSNSRPRRSLAKYDPIPASSLP